MGRKQLDGRVELVGHLAESEVEVVVVDEARETDCAIETPDAEARPQVETEFLLVGVEVGGEEDDPRTARYESGRGQGYKMYSQHREDVHVVEEFVEPRTDRPEGHNNEDGEKAPREEPKWYKPRRVLRVIETRKMR